MKTTQLRLFLNACRRACFFGGAMAMLSMLPAGVAQSEEIEKVQGSIGQRGFVFIDGEYLPPPYVLKETELGIEINGRTIQVAPSSADSLERRRAGSYRGGRHHWGGRGHRMNGQITSRIEQTEFKHSFYVTQQLNRNAVLVAEGGKEVSFLCHESQIYEFLRQLLGTETGGQTLHYASHQSAAVSKLVKGSNFSPSPTLVERARKVMAKIDGVAAESLAAEKGIQRLSMFAFPLTIAGMILSCLASGHLLTHPPRPIDLGADAKAFLHSERATVICLALLIALSGLDLAWTLLASQAGQMIELNPLGSRMVDDPYSLVAFKISVTLASCGILFAFRRRHSARLASWWLCMALTLLTCRWLVFNSMQAA